MHAYSQLGRHEQNNIASLSESARESGELLTMLHFLHQRRIDFERSAVIKDEMYWLPEVQRIEAQLGERREFEEQLREEVLEMFGRKAASSSVFESLFYPMNGRFPFLSSDKQINLQNAIDNHHVRLARISAGSSPDNRIDELQAAQTAFESALNEFLSTDEAYEYRLREGETSRRIQRSGVSVSENEFRDLYNVLDAMYRADASDFSGSPFRKLSILNSPYSDQIHAILGDARYVAFLKHEDPTYARMARVGESFGIAQDDLDSAYLIFVNTTEGIRAATNQYARGDPALIQTIRSLEIQRDRQIRTITGVDLAGLAHKASGSDRLSDALLIRSVPRN